MANQINPRITFSGIEVYRLIDALKYIQEEIGCPSEDDLFLQEVKSFVDKTINRIIDMLDELRSELG